MSVLTLGGAHVFFSRRPPVLGSAMLVPGSGGGAPVCTVHVHERAHRLEPAVQSTGINPMHHTLTIPLRRAHLSWVL